MARFDWKVSWFLALLVGLSVLLAMGAAPPGGGSTPADPAIVFVNTATSTPTMSVMNADGARRTNILSARSGAFAAPSWSPDGRSFCFGINAVLADRVTYVGLAAIDVEIVNGTPVGRNFRMLVNAGSAIFASAWSPDGATIAYVLNGDLYAIPAAGGEPSVLYAGTDPIGPSIAWSPDGTRIAYSSRVTAAATVMILDVATATTFEVCSLLQLNTASNIDWGRTDGNRLVFHATTSSGSRSVYAVDAEPGATAQLISSSSWFPTWSPDDSKLAYSTGNNLSIVIRDLQTGTVTSTGARGGQTNWRRF